MKLPTYLVRCDRCTYNHGWTGSFGDLREYKKYQLPDGRTFDVQQTLGWCLACKNLQMIEDLSVESINDELAVLRDKRGKCENEILATLSSLWSRFFNPPKNTDALGRLKYLNKEETDLSDFIIYLLQRKTSRKCLACGSFQVVDFTDGMNHPDCGGALTRTTTIGTGEFCLSRQQIHVIYDSDGNFIEKRTQHDPRIKRTAS